MTSPETSPASTALQRWLAALHAFGDADATAAAVADGARVERYGWDASRGTLVEVLQGTAEITAWCARSPRTVRFSATAPQPRGEAWRTRYSVRVGDFVNHGSWAFTLGDDGRIVWLEHRPDDLPDDWRDGIPEGMSLGPPAHSVGADHDHDHDHEHG